MNSKLLAEAKEIVSARIGRYTWADLDPLTQSNSIDDVAIEYEKLLRIGKTYKQRRDYFAGTALQALINKMPFLDEKGELGKETNTSELQEIKQSISESAWSYADWMLYVDGLREQQNLPNGVLTQ